MYRPRKATAGIYLGERRVGTLGYHDGNTWFTYDDRDPGHPVLGQAFEADPDHRRTASGSVPEWFANLLPEPGSGLRGLVGRELGRVNLHDFQVLMFSGEDLPGAVRVVPELTDTESARDDPGTRIRFSLAGVQAKFSMRWHGKGLVLPMGGAGGDWIVKLPDRRFDQVPANEYAMLNWARRVGIDVPEIKLVSAAELTGLPDGLIAAEEQAFAIRRFDRTPDGGRVHQEDFAQIREVAAENKYDRATYSGIARVVRALCPPDDTVELVRRLTAMVVMGNLDAHLKNWTIRYPDGRNARLSPAYDFISVSAYPDFRADELAFSVNGGRIARLITRDNFASFAERSGLDPDEVISIVTATLDAMADTWPEVKRECPVPSMVAEHIDARLTELPLYRFR